MDAEQWSDSEQQNFVSIYRGFAYVGKKLESYTKDGLDRTYQGVYKLLAGLPPCTQECSRVHKCQFKKWCKTCNGWRGQLLKTRKSPNVSWEYTHSWEWPNGYSNIVEVYLPASWQSDDIDLKDISTACHIWENCCKQFGLKPFIIKKIRQFRNQYFAHNPSMKASDLEKTKVFDILKDLVKDPDVQGHIDVQDSIKHLSNIEQGYQIEKWMIEVQNLIKQHNLTLQNLEQFAANTKHQYDIINVGQESIQNSQVNVVQGQEDLRQGIENIQEDITQFRSELKNLFKRSDSVFSKWYGWTENCISNISCFMFTFIIVIISLLMKLAFKHLETDTRNDGRVNQACISEQYSIPFRQDLPLLGYLNEHEALIGRQWLMDTLQNDLFHSNNSKIHGSILIAEIGYGKSAFLTKLLCPGSNYLAKDIHEHIVAFHVCKFNVRSTHFAERFIRRLVGFFAKKSAEYGNFVSMLPEGHILFNRDSCNKEPDACFDQGVTIPLKQLSTLTDTPWIVVVDAIDECESSGSNQILDLLSDRIRQLPKWLKFLITSRNVPSLTSLGHMKMDYLYSNDSRNIEDIKLYIQNFFPEKSNLDMINKLIHKSEGNFVYVIQALKWIIDNKGNEIVPDIPSDLGDIYDINFSRHFNVTSYMIPKAILEIICSTLNPLLKSDIISILRSGNISLTTDDFNKHFESLKFFIRTDGAVRVSHQALYLWLIDDQNDNYRISLANGHTLISKYLFGTMTINDTRNIVNLAIHVANSADTTMRKLFLSSNFSKSNILLKEPVLHKLIWKTPCVKALKLLIHHFPNVNTMNAGNVTPSFVAAAKGHTDQLIFLHKKGANLNFIVKGQMLVNSYEIFSKLEMIKLFYYSGYTLLHISSQHGYISTVKYILANNHSLIYIKNSLGLNAGHVACENGHLNVIKELKSLHSKSFMYECMIYASKQNHKHIAEWLVSSGFTFDCISDNQSFEALHNITTIGITSFTRHSVATFPNDSLSSSHYIGRYINPLDIWWIVLKQNPLMIAIQAGSIDVAKYILETFHEARVCHDAVGYTAALASVYFNHSELYPLFNDEIYSDRCGKIPSHLLTDDSFKAYLLDRCPEGGSVAHVIALCASSEKYIYIYLIKNRLNVIWNHPDKFGNYPIHYAVANRNYLFMYLFIHGRLSSELNRNLSLIDTLTSNGSTAYHAATLSGHYISVSLLTESFKKPVPEIKDKNGRGVTHYLVLKQFNGILGKSEMESHYQISLIFEKLLNSSSHFDTTSDDFGRNILHYIFRNSYYQIVVYLLHNQKTYFYSMLSQKDNEGNTPFDFAMKENKYYTLILPEKGSFYDIFFTFADIKVEDLPSLMSSWELTMVYVVQTFTAEDYHNFIEPNLKYIMEKSVYLFTAVLVYHKNVNVKGLQRLLVETNPNPLTSLMHVAVARHKPLAFISCNQPLTLSPLHYLSLSHEHKDSMFHLDDDDMHKILHMIFKHNRYAFNCPDKNGFNIFHYSLIGGNIVSARFLMLENITVTNDLVSLKDVFLMPLLSRLKNDRLNYIRCTEHNFNLIQEICTDTFLLELLQKKKKLLTYRFFCNDISRELSLVHLLAANGMARTLRAIANMVGIKVLSCQNKDRFTPLYLGKLFNHDTVVSVVGAHYKLINPITQAEEWLIWSILNKFPHTIVSEPLFYFSSPNLKHYSNRLSKESMIVANLFIKFTTAISSTPHHHDIMLGYLLSSEISNIIFATFLLESVYVYKGPISCNSRVALRLQQIRMFEKTMLLMESLEYSFVKGETHFSEILFKPFLAKCLRVNKLFKQLKTRAKKVCNNNSSFSIKGFKNYLLIISARKLCLKLHQMYKRVAISFLLQYGKTYKFIVPESYIFLRERMSMLKFNVEEGLQSKLNPLVAIDDTSLSKYRYVNIIKSTIAYKQLKQKIEVDTYGYWSLLNYSTVTSSVLESFMLKEPFKDLQ